MDPKNWTPALSGLGELRKVAEAYTSAVPAIESNEPELMELWPLLCQLVQNPITRQATRALCVSALNYSIVDKGDFLELTAFGGLRYQYLSEPDRRATFAAMMQLPPLPRA
jgi:hypothetical protein